MDIFLDSLSFLNLADPRWLQGSFDKCQVRGCWIRVDAESRTDCEVTWGSLVAGHKSSP